MGASVIIAIAGLGGVIASSPLAWLSELIGWRSSFMALAGLTFVDGLLIWFLVRDKPADMGLPRVEPQVKQQGGEAKPSMPVKKSLTLALGSFDFWLLAVWFFFNGGILFSFAGLWAGPYFMGAYSMTKTQAAGVIDLFSFGWVFGPLIFAWIAARFPSRSRVLGLSMSGLGLVCLWLMLRNGHMNQMELYLFALCFGFLGAGPAGVCFTAAKERFPVEMAGTVTGLVYVFPMAGSAVFQPLAGALLDMSGHMESGLGSQDFIPLFMVYTIASFAAGLAGFVFRTDRGKPKAGE
jgi:sugar phosphate permease